MTLDPDSAQPAPENALRRYWRAYGGWAELFKSTYLWLAVGTTVLTAPLWVYGGWWESAISILPSLLGFTLGGYALLVSFGDEKFKAFLITTDGERSTAFMAVSSVFVHFIVVQALALVTALIAKSFSQVPREWLHFVLSDSLPAQPGSALETAGQIGLLGWWFFGFFMLMYSVWLVIATALAVFEVTGWFNDHQLFEAKMSAAARKEEEERQALARQPSLRTTLSNPQAPRPRAGL